MKSVKGLLYMRTQKWIGASIVTFLVVCASAFWVYGQNKSDFPDGYDAVEAAPMAHKVVFENAFVRVLELPGGPSGTTVPMHHHRWPGFFLTWDTGGKTPHIRFHYPDGRVEDVPSVTTPVHPGVWKVRWAGTDPMRSLEIVDNPAPPPGVPPGPTELRIEVKCHP
jgi:hypothetical protein